MEMKCIICLLRRQIISMRQVIQHFRIPSEFFVFFSEGIYYKSGPQPATGEHNRSQSVWSVSEATVKRLGAVT